MIDPNDNSALENTGNGNTGNGNTKNSLEDSRPSEHTGDDFEAVIGLEIHVQLATETKLFCADPVAAYDGPNTSIGEVSLGLPGALPTINERAVDLAVTAGLALGCTVHLQSIFARKHYFYPDSPRGYQISQYERPLCTGGAIPYELDGIVRECPLTQIHVEDDAGKSHHDGPHGTSRIDFNRAGVPLIEVVTEPVLHSARQAAAVMRSLHEIVVFAGVSHGNMEQGHLRCDANVSIRPAGTSTLGVRTETKNLNSFRFVEAAIEHEIRRQTRVLRTGGTIHAETRLFDAEQGKTWVMRRKEDAEDYRYFPDPDLPPLELGKGRLERLRASLPELPQTRRQRYVNELGLSPEDADVLTSSVAISDLFDASRSGISARSLAHFLQGEILRLVNVGQLALEALPFPPQHLGQLVAMLDDGTLNKEGARRVLEAMLVEDASPDELVASLGLEMVSGEDEVEAALRQMLSEADADMLARYRSGQKKLFGYFMGSAMRALKGLGDPAVVRETLQRLLDEE